MTKQRKQQKILCSALLVQIEGLDHTTIITCRRHCDGYTLLKDLGYAPKTKYKVLEDGFITTDGTFVNRIEALKIAREHGQLRQDSENKMKLFSEDLY